jgi:biopolymer transport protein ExbB/TolQ
MAVEEVIFEVSDALRVPVLAATLVALALVLVEAGALVAELVRRGGRGLARLEVAVSQARAALLTGDRRGALTALAPVARSRAMRETIEGVVDDRAKPGATDRIAKRLAEFDYGSMRRLERTRILVRMGPALGLMGTLIPLSPALAGLADGNVTELTDNLRVAFSVTVAGLLIGAVAFATSLVRDRLYGQDYSDLEYVASALAPQSSAPAAHPAPNASATPPVQEATV